MSTYEQRKQESVYWFSKASDLRGGAAVLWTSINSTSREITADLGLGSGFRMDVALPLVYRMLCGMSLELLLKAVIVAHRKEVKTIHLLGELAADAGVEYTPEQFELLQILTEAIVWDGRYPVPTEKQKFHWEKLKGLEEAQLFDKVAIGDTGLMVLRRNDDLDWDSYNELWHIAFANLCDVADWIE